MSLKAQLWGVGNSDFLKSESLQIDTVASHAVVPNN